MKYFELLLNSFKKLFVVFLMVVFTSGCATKSDNIKADSVSPLAYQGYSCDQVGQEMLRIGRKVSEMAAQQDSTATKDAVAMGVGLVIFWPSLFFLAAGEDNKKEIARLKGESEALEQIAITKNCTGAIAQRDAALDAWREQQQKKNESGDALVEAKYQECISDWGESSCDRKTIENKVKKEERERNVAANVAKEPALSSENSLPQITALSAEKSTVSVEQHKKYLKQSGTISEDGTISLLDEETGKEWLIFSHDKRVVCSAAELMCKTESARLPSFQEFEALYKRYKGTETINMFKKKNYSTTSSAYTYPKYFSFDSGGTDNGTSYVANVACISLRTNVTRKTAPSSKKSLPQIAVAPVPLASQQGDSGTTDVYRTKCPNCGNVFTYQAKYAGQHIHCMKCDHDFDLP